MEIVTVGNTNGPQPLLPIWTIEPAARPDDPLWQGRHIWTRILVREHSDAFARLAAENWVKETRGDRLPPDSRTGLTDVKLYKSSELAPDAPEMIEYAGVQKGVLEVHEETSEPWKFQWR